MTELLPDPDLARWKDPLQPDQLPLGQIRAETFDVSAVPPGKRAVIYIRVSSAGQVKTDYDPEGISLPAQRKACHRKADQMGIAIVDEYVEPGRSATEMSRRIAFRQMLARIRAQQDVDYVIVYKLSRLARNRYDEALVGVELAKLDITLVSATEQIDGSPVGQLMQGMLAVINEYQSRESGADIAYKMGEKAKHGGTLGLAPLGYRNVIDTFEGRQIRTVATDDERAPFVKLAFELFATGEYTLAALAEELTDRGLLTRSSARRTARPVSASQLQRLLKDRYYLGIVDYKGEEFAGRHEALIDEELFDRVQEIVRTRGHSGERRRLHHHFLKGTVYCGECKRVRGVDQRLLLQRAIGRHGGEYYYFFCPNRRDGNCQQPFHDLGRVEEAVERHYKRKRFSAEFIGLVRRMMDEAVSDQDEAQRLLKQQLDEQIDRLDTQEENLIDLAADGELPHDKIKARLFKIQHERQRLTEQAAVVDTDLKAGQRVIDEQLNLLRDAHRLYMSAGDENKRRLNQLIYKAIYVEDSTDTAVTGNDIKDPYDALYAGQAAFDAVGRQKNSAEQASAAYRRAHADNHANKDEGTVQLDRPDTPAARWTSCFTAALSGGGLTKPQMVELRGFEPLTPCMPCRCATSCATAPRTQSDHSCCPIRARAV